MIEDISLEDLLIRNDGIVRNAVTKLGTRKDVEQHNVPNKVQCLSKEQLEALYASDPMCQRVCEYLPAQMATGGVLVQGKDIDGVTFQRYLRKTGIMRAFYRATVLAALYSRGAAIVLDIDDGKDWNQSVDVTAIKKVDVAFVADGYKVVPAWVSQFSDKPDWFNISAVLGLGTFPGTDDDVANPLAELSESFMDQGLGNVHPSRVLWFDGIWTPNDIQMREQGSISRLNLFWVHYSRYSAALQAVSNLLHRSEVLNVKKKGLLKMLAASDEKTERNLLSQLEVLVMSLHMLGIGMSDMDNEQIEVIKRSAAGLEGVINEFKRAAIAASGLTEMALFGITSVSGGLANQDLRDRMQLAELVAREQESQWRQNLELWLEYVLNAKEGPTKGKEPESWLLVFPSTLSLTPQEEGALRSQQAQTDNVYLQAQILTPEEVRSSRFGSGEWSPETTLDEEAYKAMKEQAAQAAEAQAAPPEEEAPAEEEEGGDEYAEEEYDLSEFEEFIEPSDDEFYEEEGIEEGAEEDETLEEAEPDEEANQDGLLALNLDRIKAPKRRIGETKRVGGKEFVFAETKRWRLAKPDEAGKAEGKKEESTGTKKPGKLAPPPGAREALAEAVKTKGAKLTRAEAQSALKALAQKGKRDIKDAARLADPLVAYGAGKVIGGQIGAFAAQHGIDPGVATMMGEASVQAFVSVAQRMKGQKNYNARKFARDYVVEATAVFFGKSPATIDDASLGGDDMAAEAISLAIANRDNITGLLKQYKPRIDKLSRIFRPKTRQDAEDAPAIDLHPEDAETMFVLTLSALAIAQKAAKDMQK